MEKDNLRKKENSLNISKRRRSILITALILLMTSSSLLTFAPSTNAAAAEYETYLYITAAPNPVGVNQQLGVTVIFPNVPPAQLPLSSPRYGYWENLTLTITKPDGTTETKGPLQNSRSGNWIGSIHTYYGWCLSVPMELPRADD